MATVPCTSISDTTVFYRWFVAGRRQRAARSQRNCTTCCKPFPPPKHGFLRWRHPKMAAAAHMLARQLELLTKEATGFRSQLASLKDENTRLRREVENTAAAAQTEHKKSRQLQAELGSILAQNKELKAAVSASVKSKEAMKREHEARISSIMAQFNELKEERAAQERHAGREESRTQQRDKQQMGDRVKARNQGLELKQLRLELGQRERALAEEADRRRKVEKERKDSENEKAALGKKLSAMKAANQQLKLELEQARLRGESQAKELKEVMRASESVGPYAQILEAAQKAVRGASAASGAAGGGRASGPAMVNGSPGGMVGGGAGPSPRLRNPSKSSRAPSALFRQRKRVLEVFCKRQLLLSAPSPLLVLSCRGVFGAWIRRAV